MFWIILFFVSITHFWDFRKCYFSLRLIPQFLINKDNFTLHTQWCTFNYRYNTTNPVRAVTIITFISLNRTWRFCSQPFGIQGGSYIFTPGISFTNICCNFISSYNDITGLRSKSSHCNTITCSVDIYNFPSLRYCALDI